MAKFAAGTQTSVAYSRAEIEKLIGRFGAVGFLIALDVEKAIIQFSARNRLVRLTLTLPTAAEFPRKDSQQAEERRRWRSLTQLLKAKLVAVDDGLVEFEEEFLPHVVLADGSTVYERTRGDLAIEYQGGQRKLYLLPGGSQ